jgi:soluble calcium-activated nucleotidase 1
MRTEYEFALVADLDLASRNPQEFKWHSYLKKAVLTRHPNGNFSIVWTDTIQLTSQTATNNRSMELSELIKFKGSLLSVCDYTGIVYKISPDGQVFQRYAIADGNGKEPKPFKAEWASLKDGLLHIGSIGKEWTRNGEILHFNPQWVKTIDSCGYIKNHDWGMRYNFLRNITNTTYPGYLIHEAVTWDPSTRNWLFLPRRASSLVPYSPENEEFHGANLLIVADEDFKSANATRVGPLEPEWGFTSMKLIPETNEIIALKVREITSTTTTTNSEGESKSTKSVITQTKLTIFDRQGRFKLEPDPWVMVSEDTKYEGLEFL